MGMNMEKLVETGRVIDAKALNLIRHTIVTSLHPHREYPAG